MTERFTKSHSKSNNSIIQTENEEKHDLKRMPLAKVATKRSAFLGVSVICITVLYLIPSIVQSASAATCPDPSDPPEIRAESEKSTMSSNVIRKLSVDFEVFGKVQGVWFRKHTKTEADRLQLRGWCENTPHKTVRGQIQGPADNIQSMKAWLERTGSPMSNIKRAEFNNEKQIDDFTFPNFSIRK